MNLDDIGYYLFMQEAEKKEKEKVHNEKEFDLETEQPTNKDYTG